MKSKSKNVLAWLIGVGVVFPLFFQLSGGIYRDVFPMIDSLGVLSKLPLPLSIFVCFLAIVYFAGKWRKAACAVATIVGAAIAGLLSVWLAGDSMLPAQRKILMLAQVCLPLVGLLLGQILDDPRKIIAQAFLIVVSIVVPLQLLATWLQGGLVLTHYVYAFSVYSHLQYVPLIMVCAYAFALTSLWDEQRVWLCLIALPMAVYLAASLSFLPIFAFVALITVFAACRLWQYRRNLKLITLSILLLVFIATAGLTYYGRLDGQRTSVEGQQPLYSGKFKVLAEGKLPVNVIERFADWTFFGRAIIENKTTLLVGHTQPMLREIRSSPHNFYIDIAYTFGLLGLLPIVGLIGYTAYLWWQRRKNLGESTWWLFAIVAYLVLIDSNFKVTLRQPYPGIFAYFLWGLLLSRLQSALPGKSNG